MAKSNVFRKIALDRLSSPEQLDQLVTVTTPSGWTALLGIGALLVMTLIWGVYGKIPTTVMGGGILIKTGGVASVVAPVSGQIDSVYVREGDAVKKGQIIARISQPGLLDEIRQARIALDDLVDNEQQIADFGSTNYRLQLNSTIKERANLEQAIRADGERAKWLNDKITAQQSLLEEGLITKQTLIDTQNTLEEAKLAIEKNRGELKKLEAREQELAAERDQQLLASQQLINQARRDLELKEAELEFSTRVISSYTGVVVETTGFEGQVVSPGVPLLSLELTGEGIQDLQALIYMPPEMGKQIETGMLMRVSPQTIKREEFGYMLAIVTDVAEFPSSSAGMMRYLKNQTLVDQFAVDGAPIAVFADLIPDTDTVSGYKWSSPKGPPTRVFSGTLCGGSVEVRTQPPLSLMIPYMKKRLGLD